MVVELRPRRRCSDPVRARPPAPVPAAHCHLPGDPRRNLLPSSSSARDRSDRRRAQLLCIASSRTRTFASPEVCQAAISARDPAAPAGARGAHGLVGSSRVELKSGAVGLASASPASSETRRCYRVGVDRASAHMGRPSAKPAVEGTTSAGPIPSLCFLSKLGPSPCCRYR